MAKKKAESEWNTSSLDAYFTTQMGARASKDDLLDSAEAAACDIGLPLPYLCQRFLFQRTTFPLQRTTLLFGLPGCLAGDTIIRVNRAGLAKKMTIAHVVRMANGGTASGHAWNLEVPTHISRADGDRVRLARLKSAWSCGVKETFTLTTVDGRVIRATAEHPFMTADGSFVKLGDLRQGDAICVYVGRTKNPRRRKHYRDRATRYHPRQRVNPAGGFRVPEHHLAYEAGLNGVSLDEFLTLLRQDPVRAAGMQYLPTGTIVHHRDHNHTNNAADNLEVVASQTAHNAEHLDEIDGNVLPKIGTAVVASVVLYGEEETYDMEVEDDPHCYLANDFVVHNSNKSALMYWFYDLFRQHGGKYLHLDTEDKDTPILRLSLTGYDSAAGFRRPCTSMDAFQEAVKTYVSWFQGECGKAGGPGKRVPFVLGIDSLTAKMTQSAQDKMDADKGAAGRRFADEARSLSDWFKYVPNMLQEWPIGLIAVNHDKPVPSTVIPGAIDHKSPGGQAPLFYATYRILVTKAGQLKQDATGWEGNRIKLEMYKSSLGSDRRRIEIDFAWKCEAAPSKSGKAVVMAQQSFWNWHKATIEFLMQVTTNPGSKSSARAAAINDLLGLAKQTGGRYSAKGLGIAPADAIKPSELGPIIESSTSILSQLEPALGIHSSTPYLDGVDFDEQLATARASVDDLMPDLSALSAPVDAEDESEPNE